MSSPLPRPLPPDLGCDRFRERLHVRVDLSADERTRFDGHAAACRPCARVLLEAERLDDLLLSWRVPAAAARSGLPFEERVMTALRGDGPAASCAEAAASLHHYVAGDLEPWLAARVERHVARCRDCADQLDEVGHSRRVWLGWKAPDPPPTFADELIRRLEPETRAARRRRQVVELVFGAVRVPRWAAAFVLASVTLLSLGVLKMRGSLLPPADGRPTALPTLIDHGGEGVARLGRPSLPAIAAEFAPVGRGDPTGSLSPDVRGGRSGSLRSALRGE